MPWQPKGTGCMKHSVACLSREVTVPLYIALVWSHFEYYVQFRTSQYKKNMLEWEQCQEQFRWRLEKILQQRTVGMEQPSQGSGHGFMLTEFNKCLDNILTHMVCF